METTSSTMVTKLTKKLTKKKKRELCSKEDGNFKNHGNQAKSLRRILKRNYHVRVRLYIKT